ncbi:ras-like protein family member 12 [Haliotis cracherodii]|uniref:ras-like protein family member 12 n=1 Tax=Haliotis cracherodii TaxID=6455 RepID=UPI0039EA2027
MSGRGKVFHRNGGAPEYNIALVGSLGVGKSALTVKYITKRFIMEYDPDLEGTYTKHEDWDGQELLVNIMDTCDKDDSEAMRYLKWADGFLVVYSITSRQSFDKAREYLDLVTQHLKNTSRECPVALVGNKIDLERYRQISKAEGSGLAAEVDCSFFETTAAEEFEHVEGVFQRVLQDIHQEKYGHVLQPLVISEDNAAFFASARRPKSPRGTSDRKEEKNTAKKTPTTFNKLFKIFN